MAAIPLTEQGIHASTWDVALDAFAAHLRFERRKYSTIKGYRSRLLTLVEQHPSGPASVSSDALATWLDEVTGSARTSRLGAARGFYMYALRCGLVEKTPLPQRTPARRTSTVLCVDDVPEAWRDPLTDWVHWMLAAGRRTSSLTTMLAYLRTFAREHPDPWGVTSREVMSWLARHPWKAETRRSASQSLRSFYARSVKLGRIAVDPAESIGSIKVPRALPRPIPEDALSGALATATDRDKLIMLLAAYAGLRCGEVAAVRPATDVQEGFLYVTGKGGRLRRVPLHPVLSAELDREQARRRSGRVGSGFRYAGFVDPDGYLFPSPTFDHIRAETVVALLGRILPDGWTGHTLRHRFASAAYASSRDLRAVQELLGHASPTTTAIYTLTPDTALCEAVWGIR